MIRCQVVQVRALRASHGMVHGKRVEGQHVYNVILSICCSIMSVPSRALLKKSVAIICGPKC